MSLFDVKKEWEKEWEGMPEFIQKDLSPFHRIIINFKNEKDIKKFEKLIGRKLTNKTQSIWYPQEKIDKYADKRYIDEP